MVEATAPREGQSATVQLHSLSSLLQHTAEYQVLAVYRVYNIRDTPPEASSLPRPPEARRDPQERRDQVLRAEDLREQGQERPRRQGQFRPALGDAHPAPEAEGTGGGGSDVMGHWCISSISAVERSDQNELQ